MKIDGPDEWFAMKESGVWCAVLGWEGLFDGWHWLWEMREGKEVIVTSRPYDTEAECRAALKVVIGAARKPRKVVMDGGHVW